MPPLLTVVPLATPPELTISAPLLPAMPIMVLLTIVPTARPPELTINRPVLLSVVPEADAARRHDLEGAAAGAASDEQACVGRAPGGDGDAAAIADRDAAGEAT